MGFRLTPNGMALLTLVAGGALTYGGAWAQRRWRREDDAAQREAERAYALEDRRLARIDAACEDILRATAEVTQMFANQPRRPTAILPLVATMRRQALLLPEPLRERAESCALLLWQSDEVAKRLGERGHAVRVDAATELMAVAAAVLRREPPPPEPDWYAARNTTLDEVLGALDQQRQRRALAD